MTFRLHHHPLKTKKIRYTMNHQMVKTTVCQVWTKCFSYYDHSCDILQESWGFLFNLLKKGLKGSAPLKVGWSVYFTGLHLNSCRNSICFDTNASRNYWGFRMCMSVFSSWRFLFYVTDDSWLRLENKKLNSVITMKWQW